MKLSAHQSVKMPRCTNTPGAGETIPEPVFHSTTKEDWWESTSITDPQKGEGLSLPSFYSLTQEER